MSEADFEQAKEKPREVFNSILGLAIQTTALSVQQEHTLAVEESAGNAAAQQGNLRSALQHYQAALQSLPAAPPTDIDKRVRAEVIKVVLQLDPRPAIPQDAIRHASYAEAAVEEAQKDANPSHLNDAVTETQKALRIAPWWAQAYFSLAVLLEKTQRPGDAAQALQLYLLADPRATIAQKNGMNAQDVQVKIYKLQYEAKQQ